MSDTPHALPAGTRLGEFEILRVVGTGGFGIVYKALDLDLQREVAIKEYLPSQFASRSSTGVVTVLARTHAETFGIGLRSFVNEARLLARFDHPALVKVYRYWEANGTAYMAMPFYEGLTLAQAVRAMPKPPDQAWLMGMLTPLLSALELLHSQQVFHRDISPDNILLLPNGQPVLLDFGAARQVIGNRTQTLTAILKPNYAPIEQYADIPGMKQGPWTDLYALAAVVYACLTGKPPSPASTRGVMDDVRPLTQVGADLTRRHSAVYTPAFLMAWQAALAVRPAQRPQSVAELKSALAQTGNTAPPGSAFEPEAALDVDDDRTVIRPSVRPEHYDVATSGKRPSQRHSKARDPAPAEPGHPANPIRTGARAWPIGLAIATLMLASAGGYWALRGSPGPALANVSAETSPPAAPKPVGLISPSVTAAPASTASQDSARTDVATASSAPTVLAPEPAPSSTVPPLAPQLRHAPLAADKPAKPASSVPVTAKRAIEPSVTERPATIPSPVNVPREVPAPPQDLPPAVRRPEPEAKSETAPPAASTTANPVNKVAASIRVDAVLNSQGEAVTLANSIKAVFPEADDALLQHITHFESLTRALPWKSAVAIGIQSNGATATGYAFRHQRTSDATERALKHCSTRMPKGQCFLVYENGSLSRANLREWLLNALTVTESDSGGAVKARVLKGLGRLPTDW